MNPELDGRKDEESRALIDKRGARGPLSEEESVDLRAKLSSYALINRPSPPF